MKNVLTRLCPGKYFDFDFDLIHISLDSYVTEYFEGSSQIIVEGRLKATISFWQNNVAFTFSLDTLSFGLNRIPFLRELTVEQVIKSLLMHFDLICLGLSRI